MMIMKELNRERQAAKRIKILRGKRKTNIISKLIKSMMILNW
jgi:hypothetical protein